MTFASISTGQNPAAKSIPAFGGWCPQVDATRANSTIWVRRIHLSVPCSANAVYFVSGANGTGNVSVGLYLPTSATTATGALLLASGNAAHGGAYGVPTKMIPFSAAVDLPAGDYYLTIQSENSTQTFVANPQWAAPAGVSMEVTRAYDGTMPATLGTASDSATNITLALRTV